MDIDLKDTLNHHICKKNIINKSHYRMDDDNENKWKWKKNIKKNLHIKKKNHIFVLLNKKKI
jgi:hypothetical protein